MYFFNLFMLLIFSEHCINKKFLKSFVEVSSWWYAVNFLFICYANDVFKNCPLYHYADTIHIINVLLSSAMLNQMGALFAPPV